MSFEITFLGSSGGPVETSNCCVLIKNSDVSYTEILQEKCQDEVLCIDAGSGIHKLGEIIYNERHQVETNTLLNLYNDAKPIRHYYHKTMKLTKPFSNLPKSINPIKLSMSIFDNIKHYLISHPHLDHINGLILNSANFSNDSPKQIIASNETIDALDRYIFNGIIWPNMQEFNIVQFNTIKYDETIKINDCFEIRMFKLSHGKLVNHDNKRSSISLLENYSLNYEKSSSLRKANFNGDLNGLSNGTSESSTTPYLSSAFLVHHLKVNKHILIFGDFESDLISNLNYNQLIWQEISHLIVNNKLNIIIMECSHSHLNQNQLYGHLNPDYLINELINLNKICKELNQDSHPLQNLNIIINHIKEVGDYDPRIQVLDKLNELNTQNDLRIKFSIALTGVSVNI